MVPSNGAATLLDAMLTIQNTNRENRDVRLFQMLHAAIERNNRAVDTAIASNNLVAEVVFGSNNRLQDLQDRDGFQDIVEAYTRLQDIVDATIASTNRVLGIVGAVTASNSEALRIELGRRNRRLGPNGIQQIPHARMTATDPPTEVPWVRVYGDSVCCICYSDMSEHTQAQVVLQCRHCIHFECCYNMVRLQTTAAVGFFRGQVLCPMCRVPSILPHP
jgi:Ring finger domain